MTGLVVVFVATLAGLIAAHIWTGGDVLLAQSAPTHRVDVYSQLAGTSVGLLGISLTVLAILVALPDRPGVIRLRKAGSLDDLEAKLLATAALCLSCLVACHIGAAIDDGKNSIYWLAYLVMALAVTALSAFCYFGVGFALALRRAGDPPDAMDSRAQAVVPRGSKPS